MWCYFHDPPRPTCDTCCDTCPRQDAPLLGLQESRSLVALGAKERQILLYVVGPRRDGTDSPRRSFFPKSRGVRRLGPTMSLDQGQWSSWSGDVHPVLNAPLISRKERLEVLGQDGEVVRTWHWLQFRWLQFLCFQQVHGRLRT